MRRVDLQVYGLPVDALVVACYPRGLSFDLTLNLGEIVEPAAGNMVKFGPFLLPCYTRGSMRDMHFMVVGLVVALAREVDEL